MAKPPSESPADWRCHLQRWQDAGLIDPTEAAAINQWEQARAQHEDSASGAIAGSWLASAADDPAWLVVACRRPSAVCIRPLGSSVSPLACGAAGASHDGFAWGGSWFSKGFPAMGLGLHGVGTISFGAAVFLFAQIFHLEVAWSFQWGLLLWSLGAAVGWLLLRQWPQLVLLSLVGPAWLMAVLALQLDRLAPEWFAQSGRSPSPPAPFCWHSFISLPHHAPQPRRGNGC